MPYILAQDPITLIAIFTWIVGAAITVAFYIGIAYLGGILFGPDLPEADTGPTANAQSRSWNPRSTQQEGIARPRACGKNMHHGNIVAKWTSVVSNREKLHMIIEFGDGPTKGTVVVDDVKQVWFNDQPAANFGDVDIQERLGTMNQTCMTGFEKTKLEYQQGIELKKDEPVIVTTPNDYFDDLEYTILWPNGLYRWGSEGKKRKLGYCRIKVRIREHPDGGWTEISNVNYQLKVIEPLFLLRTVSALWDHVERGKQYDLEFTNLTGPLTRHINNVYLKSFREVIDIAFTRPGKALIGIRAVATEKLSGRIDVKVIREDKLVRVWNGSTWTITYSRNRAWVVYDVLTQPVISGDGNGGGPFTVEYYEGIDPARLDLEFFYAWAEFCSIQIPDGYSGNEDRIACDTILDFQTDVWTFANELANIGRAHLYWQGHLLTGWIDKAEASVTDLVTMDNIMARTWKNAWSEKNTLAGKVEVFFQDSRQGYERTSAPLPNESAGRYTKIISIEGVGITTRGTAIHLANHALLRNQLIRNVNSFRQYKDAFRYHLGDVIRLQHKIPDWGVGYRVIESTAANKVTLDRTCTADPGDTLYVRSYDTILEIVVTDDYIVDSVADKIVTITTTWDVTPIKNNLCAIGPTGSIQLRRIIKIESAVTNYFDVTVETYDVVLFDADALVPDLPDQNYIWAQPANPLTRPVTRGEVIELIGQLVPPPPDVDSPVTSNCTWTGNEVDTVTWAATDATEPIIFSYKGVSYEITPDSTTDEFVYWDPNFTTTFRHTNDAAVAVALGKWYMCRNIAGVAYPTTPFSSIHAGVLQAGTITAAQIIIGSINALALANAPAEAGADVTSDHADDVIYRQASAPAHKAGRLWFDSTTNKLKRSTGSAWEIIDGVGDRLADANASLLANWRLDIENGAGRPAGIYWCYQIGDFSQLDWLDSGKAEIKILSTPSNAGYGFPAIPIDDKQKYTVVVRHKSSAASADGLYLSMAQYNAALPVDKTHIGTAGGANQTQTNTVYIASDDPMPGTSWTVDTYTYTPTAGTKYASLIMWVNNPTEAGVEYHVDYVLMYLVPKDADQIAESASKKWAGETGADVTGTHPDDVIYYTPDSSPPSHLAGRLWYDTTAGKLKRSNGTTWNIVGDETSQHQDDISLANLAEKSVDSLVDGTTYKKFLNTERTKLTGVETGADVTGDHQAATIVNQGDLAVLNVVTGSYIDDLTVDTLHIKDNAVTVPCASFASGSGTTIMVDITVSGEQNIYILAGALVTLSRHTGGFGWEANPIRLQLHRDATEIYDTGANLWNCVNVQGIAKILPHIGFYDSPAAGSYTYKLTISGASNVEKRYIRVQELKK